jgi:hypothetical protein
MKKWLTALIFSYFGFCPSGYFEANMIERPDLPASAL